jgi:hypothetical protein
LGAVGAWELETLIQKVYVVASLECSPFAQKQYNLMVSRKRHKMQAAVEKRNEDDLEALVAVYTTLERAKCLCTEMIFLPLQGRRGDNCS